MSLRDRPGRRCAAGAARGARFGRLPAAHRVRECRQSRARAHDGPNAGARGAGGARRGPRPNRTAARHRRACCSPHAAVRRACCSPAGACWRSRHFVGDRVPRIDEVALSMPVLLVAFGAMAATGVLVGLAPVVHLAASRHRAFPARRRPGRRRHGAERPPAIRAGGCAGGDCRHRAGRRPAADAQPRASAACRHRRRARPAADVQRPVHPAAHPRRTRDDGRQRDRGDCRRSPASKRRAARPGSRRSPRSAERPSRSPGSRTRPSTTAGAYFIAASPCVLPHDRHADHRGTGVRVAADSANAATGRRGVGDARAAVLSGRQRDRAAPAAREPGLLGRLANDRRCRSRRAIPGPRRWSTPHRLHAVRADAVPLDVRPRPNRRAIRWRWSDRCARRSDPSTRG